MLAFFISIIVNQHFILGLLYMIGRSQSKYVCVLNISVWFIYIWGLCGYEGQTTILVSVAC